MLHTFYIIQGYIQNTKYKITYYLRLLIKSFQISFKIVVTLMITSHPAPFLLSNPPHPLVYDQTPGKENTFPSASAALCVY